MPGYNPVHGFDTGPPPPPYDPNKPLPVHTFISQGQVAQYPQYVQYQYPYVQQPVQYYVQQPQPQPIYVNQPAAPQPIIINQPAAAQPVVVQSSTGGGTPGYASFRVDVCKVHVLKCATPPWELTPGTYIHHEKHEIPIDTKLSVVMERFGCNNADPKKNKVYEVQEAGNGKWSSGMIHSGDQKEKMGKAIKEFGWNTTRTGKPGEPPVVWVWFTKGGD